MPIIDLATKVMLGQKLKDLGYGTGLYPEARYYAVKALSSPSRSSPTWIPALARR